MVSRLLTLGASALGIWSLLAGAAHEARANVITIHYVADICTVSPCPPWLVLTLNKGMDPHLTWTVQLTGHGPKPDPQTGTDNAGPPATVTFPYITPNPFRGNEVVITGENLLGVEHWVVPLHGSFTADWTSVEEKPKPTMPEVSTWAMLLLGFAGLGAGGYLRSRKAQALKAGSTLPV